MKYTEGNIGRIFILRLEDGDKIPQTIEDFAKEKLINSGLVFFIGGADKGSKVIVGPQDGSVEKPIPVIRELHGASEAMGLGTIFIDEEGVPKLHLHSTFGRCLETLTGCTREGVDIWKIGEIVILEMITPSARRKKDSQTGFEFLEIDD